MQVWVLESGWVGKWVGEAERWKAGRRRERAGEEGGGREEERGCLDVSTDGMGPAVGAVATPSRWSRCGCCHFVGFAGSFRQPRGQAFLVQIFRCHTQFSPRGPNVIQASFRPLNPHRLSGQSENHCPLVLRSFDAGWWLPCSADSKLTPPPAGQKARPG